MDDNSFGARLAAARRAAGYNQTEVAKYITEAGFPVRTQAVSKWERGTTLPSARQLVELCRLYHIRDVVAAFAPAEERRAVRTLPLYRLAVSAGTGELLDGTDYDTVEVGDEGIAERGLRRAHCRRQHGAALCSRADRLGAPPGDAPLRRDRRVPL